VKMDRPVVYGISEVVEENPSTRTFLFDVPCDAAAGQFAMLWIPRVDEKPMSYSRVGDKTCFTVRRVGPFTEKLHKMKEGDRLGIRGPIGRGFTPVSGRILIISGGCGSSPLAPLAESLKGEGVTVIVGAKTKDELLFVDRFRECGEVLVATDDGSEGEKGTAVEAMEKLMKNEKFDQTYACGPEAMLAEAAKVCRKHKTPLQLSLERHMKCGIGLCGTCCIDGLRVCTEGPVFTAEELVDTEFGKTGGVCDI